MDVNATVYLQQDHMVLELLEDDGPTQVQRLSETFYVTTFYACTFGINLLLQLKEKLNLC